MKAYHYSRSEDWMGIKNGSWKNRDKPGLGASRRMGREDPEAFNTGAVFCLSAPRPESWTANKDFPNAWDHLTRNVGSLLLEIELDGLEADTRVVDWVFMEAFLNGVVDAPYGSSTRREAEGKYIRSSTPVNDFVQNQADFSLPEITVRRSVDFDRITLAEDQTLLAASLANYRWSDFLEYEMRLISNIPGLTELL